MRIPFSELEFDKVAIDYIQVKYHDTLFTGIAYEEEEGWLEEACFVNGEAQGAWNVYNPQGALRQQGWYEHGCPHAEQKEWYENGHLKQHEYYEHGELVKREEWNEYGQRLVYYNRDERIAREWHENGRLKREVIYGEQSWARGKFREWKSEKKWDEKGQVL